MVLANGWLPKGLSQSGNTDVTPQVAHLAHRVSIRLAPCTALTSSKATLQRITVSGAFFTFRVTRFTIRQNQRNATSVTKTLLLMVAVGQSVNTVIRAMSPYVSYDGMRQEKLRNRCVLPCQTTARVSNTPPQALQNLSGWPERPTHVEKHSASFPANSCRPPLIPCLFLGIPPAFQSADTEDSYEWFFCGCTVASQNALVLCG